MEIKWGVLNFTTTAADDPMSTGLEKIKAVKNISHKSLLNIIAEEHT